MNEKDKALLILCTKTLTDYCDSNRETIEGHCERCFFKEQVQCPLGGRYPDRFKEWLSENNTRKGWESF